MSLEEFLITLFGCSIVEKLSTHDIKLFGDAVRSLALGNLSEVVQHLNQIVSDSGEHAATYFKAIVEDTRFSGPASDYPSLALLLTSKKPVDARLLARVYTFLGSAHATHGRLYLSLEHFGKALQLDENDALPLLNMARIYHALNLPDAEQELLELLAQSMLSSRLGEKFVVGFRIEHDKYIPTLLKLSSVHVLYGLARRLLDLKRFESSANWYLDLLAILMEYPLQMEDMAFSGVWLPPVRRIFQETALALLLCDRHLDSIAVCDETSRYNIISCTDTSLHACQCHETCNLWWSLGLWDGVIVSNPHTAAPNAHEVIPISTRRLVDLSKNANGHLEKECTCFEGFHIDMISFLIKGVAFSKLGNDVEALLLFNRILSTLGYKSEESMNDISEDDHRPNVKRLRLECIGPTTNQTEDSYVVSFEQHMKSLTYVSKAITDMKQEFAKDALHSLRLGVQCDPDSLIARYYLTQLLIKMGRKEEALQDWLRFRSRPVNKTFSSKCLASLHYMYPIPSSQLHELDSSTV